MLVVLGQERDLWQLPRGEAALRNMMDWGLQGGHRLSPLVTPFSRLSENQIFEPQLFLESGEQILKFPPHSIHGKSPSDCGAGKTEQEMGFYRIQAGMRGAASSATRGLLSALLQDSFWPQGTLAWKGGQRSRLTEKVADGFAEKGYRPPPPPPPLPREECASPPPVVDIFLA